MSSADVLAQERDAKFKVWLQNKSLKEKAFEVFRTRNLSLFRWTSPSCILHSPAGFYHVYLTLINRI